jgi:hypothetical protein
MKTSFGRCPVTKTSLMPKVKLFQRKKVQGLKVKVAKNRGDRVYHLTEFGLRIQGKKIVLAQEKKY